MNDIPVGVGNDLPKPIRCAICEETMHYADELVFLLGGVVVMVSERYPDWDKAYCVTCAEEKNLI